MKNYFRTKLENAIRYQKKRGELREIEEIYNSQQKTIDSISDQLRVLDSIKQQLETIDSKLSYVMKSTDESIWADIFHDSIALSDWYRNQNSFFNRSAIGYPAAYLLFRTLNDVHPKNILELGLGQTTKIITQYTSRFNDAEHTVVENNTEWIEYFSRSNELSDNTKIIQMNWTFSDFNGNSVRTFEGFTDNLQGNRYDLIVIDAPLGMDMKVYSRIDVALLLPDMLSDDFAIILDDTDRIGERNTLNQMCETLKNNGIEHYIGTYSGLKSTSVIVSTSWKFLTSLRFHRFVIGFQKNHQWSTPKDTLQKRKHSIFI